MGIPETLYKYRNWNDPNHRRLLEKGEIFFTSPKHFNDPFDCKICFDIHSVAEVDIKNVRERMIRRDHPSLTRKERRKLDRKMVKGFNRDLKDPEFLSHARAGILDSLERTFAIFSLSGSCDNILMWSHYADKHSGFCVGFNVPKLCEYLEKVVSLPKTLLEIKYQDSFPSIRFHRQKERIEVLDDMLSMKARNWRYELEHRLVVNGKVDFAVDVPADVIESVILGVRMSQTNRKAAVQLLHGFGASPKIFIAETKSDQFALDLIENQELR